jgi:hypothetical protein
MPSSTRGELAGQLARVGAVDQVADRVPVDRVELVGVGPEQERELRALHAGRVAQEGDRAFRVVGLARRQVLGRGEPLRQGRVRVVRVGRFFTELFEVVVGRVGDGSGSGREHRTGVDAPPCSY